MNRLKSIFVSAYALLVLLIAAASIVVLVRDGVDLTWLGALVTVLPFIGLFLRAVTSRHLTRTSHKLPVLTALTTLGGVLAAYGFWSSGMQSLVGITAAATGVMGFFLFDFWYSSFGRRVNDKLTVGRMLPDFGAVDVDGSPVHASDLRGRPVLFMFYRGNWCPFCMAQVREITARYRELHARGVEVILVSPQPTELTERVARIYEVPVRFWVDRDLAAARTLDIAQDYGVPAGAAARKYGTHTVLPTVVIVDAQGRILFTDQTDNYRVRPDPEIFLRALANHGL